MTDEDPEEMARRLAQKLEVLAELSPDTFTRILLLMDKIIARPEMTEAEIWNEAAQIILGKADGPTN